MFRLLTLTLWVAACFAQTPADLFNRPPADVDQALRARITEFFQDHVDGKFRQAEALVAEDTKDFFYTGNKPKYLSFEIQRITYSDGYTRAKALVLCEQTVVFPGFGGQLKVPTPSYWKLVDGQWYWYVNPEDLHKSPFGEFKPGPGTSAGPVAIPNPADVLKAATAQVKADKQAVTLKLGGSDQVTIANSAPGVMSISLLGSTTGVKVTLDRMDIPAGEKAVVTFRAGNDAKPGTVSLRVDQTNHVIPIQVSIQ
ncbi:MAG TPA: hypothetical protein VG096_10910 [Bryobacteraceae bacterium]|jgi:hypothetical protein|nr:hypothetical protein [Bryobacteraceae bacterium]